MDPDLDPGGPKTRGSGSGSATQVISAMIGTFRSVLKNTDARNGMTRCGTGKLLLFNKYFASHRMWYVVLRCCSALLNMSEVPDSNQEFSKLESGVFKAEAHKIKKLPREMDWPFLKL